MWDYFSTFTRYGKKKKCFSLFIYLKMFLSGDISGGVFWVTEVFETHERAKHVEELHKSALIEAKAVSFCIKISYCFLNSD